MKNKGFTLVELLGVIIILGIIMVIVFPIVSDIIKDSEDTVYNKHINTILSATYDWTLKNAKYLPDTNKKTFITLGRLKNEGYIENDVINVKTGDKFSDSLVISIQNVGSNYNDKKENSKKSGNYLYTVELDLLTSTNYQKNKPIITLNDYEYSADGIYTRKLDLNETNINTKYSATNYNKEIDLTSNVVINITRDSTQVSKINTSKFGIYQIIYTVVDDEGYSNSIIENVIVGDEEAPKLTIPENKTIPTSTQSLDLLKGASCKDNSGDCEIKVNGTINFGVVGKYVIEYTAVDKSGNTSEISKRIITIE